MFLGFVTLESSITLLLQTRNSSSVPIDADAAPREQIYGSGGSGPGNLLTAVSGQMSAHHSGTVTGVSAANPAVITSAAHGLQTGARITLSGVTGSGAITNANTTTTITRVDADSFSMDGVNTTGGAYTSGGSWHMSGLYSRAVTCSAANGFAAGNTYAVVSTYAISSSARADLDTFTVI